MQLSQKGMSLVQVMMAGAMMAGLGLVVSKMGLMSQKTAQSTEAAMDIVQAQGLIEKTLLDHESCKATLENISIPEVDEQVFLPEGIKRVASDGDIRTVAKGLSRDSDSDGGEASNMGGISVTDVFLKRDESDAFQIGVSFYKGTKVQFEINNPEQRAAKFEQLANCSSTECEEQIKSELFKVKGKVKQQFGGLQKTKFFNIVVELNDAGTSVEKCYSQFDNAVETSVVQAVEKSCLSLDPNATVGENLNCELSQSFKTEIVSDAIGATVPLYLNSAGLLTTSVTFDFKYKTCSKCSKSGCSPPGCPAGYQNLGKSCSKGGTCGFKPRWRNCKRTCRKAKSPVGRMLQSSL